MLGSRDASDGVRGSAVRGGMRTTTERDRRGQAQRTRAHPRASDGRSVVVLRRVRSMASRRRKREADGLHHVHARPRAVRPEQLQLFRGAIRVVPGKRQVVHVHSRVLRSLRPVYADSAVASRSTRPGSRRRLTPEHRHRHADGCSNLLQVVLGRRATAVLPAPNGLSGDADGLRQLVLGETAAALPPPGDALG